MRIYLLVFLISLCLSVAVGFAVVPLLKRVRAGQSILSYVKEHKSKEGTPTMGGVIFIFSATAVALAFCGRGELRNMLVLCSAGVAYGVVGFLDDLLKVRGRKNEGLKPLQKIGFQLVVAAIISIYLFVSQKTRITIPFSSITIDVKFGIIPLYIFVFIATTNCVNLTDGLDGLAAGVSYVYLAMLAVLMLLQRGGGMLETDVILCISLVGAIVGFLLFNTNRATVFMGDTGSLSLGGFISVISAFSGNVLFIPLFGVMFVVSGVSVILQVLYYKKTRKRIFLMAPFHHHLQMRGMSEGKIAVCYKIMTLAVGLACLSYYA